MPEPSGRARKKMSLRPWNLVRSGEHTPAAAGKEGKGTERGAAQLFQKFKRAG